MIARYRRQTPGRAGWAYSASMASMNSMSGMSVGWPTRD